MTAESDSGLGDLLAATEEHLVPAVAEIDRLRPSLTAEARLCAGIARARMQSVIDVRADWLEFLREAEAEDEKAGAAEVAPADDRAVAP